MVFFIQMVLSGLAVGSIYALVAFGFCLVYKSTKVVNFALGDLLTLGAFLLWTLSVQLHLPFWLSILIGIGLASLLGVIIERLALRPMVGRSLLPTVMVTIGLSSFIGGVTNMFYAGPTQVYPDWLPNISLELGEIMISSDILTSFIIAIATFIFFTLFFRYTKLGLDMRAVAEDQQIAQAVGAKVSFVFSMTWVLAAVLSMIGGLVLGTIQGINQSLLLMGMKVFPVVLLGGLESFLGAIIGGLIIGVAETLSIGYINEFVGGGFEEIISYVIMIIILIFKPYGLFGLERIERI